MLKTRIHSTQPIINPYDTYRYINEPLSNNDISFLTATAKIAATSTYRFRMAALIVKSGSVLGGNVNMPKITPDTPPNRMSTHAEIRALKSVKNVQGATIYIARLKSQDQCGLAKPCIWCMNHMINAGISKVVFTINDGVGSSFYVNMITWI